MRRNTHRIINDKDTLEGYDDNIINSSLKITNQHPIECLNSALSLEKNLSDSALISFID
jgi:hypothetical protein